jgi:PKHD-type hydroxylase
MLLNLPNILSADDLAQANMLLANEPWADGRESAGLQARGVKYNQQPPHDSKTAKAIRHRVPNGRNHSTLFSGAAVALRVSIARINHCAARASE